jgi:lipopolysaccharide transport system permease protein
MEIIGNRQVPSAPDHAASAPTMVISSAARLLPDFAELWRARHLAGIFVWRNLKLRFKQSALGLLWVVLQPIAATGVFAIFFGALASIPSGDVPYPIFVAVGLIIWQFFSRALANATASLVAMTGVLSKIYLPRLIVPLSSVLTDTVDFVIVFVLLVAVLGVGGYLPARALVAAPACTILVIAAALACALWTSACDVLFRDTRVIVGFVLQFGLFFTPVIYPLELVPSGWRTLYLLNPLVPLITAFRWSLIATAVPPPLWAFALAVATIAVVGFGGLLVFTRIERLMMDRI